MVTEVVQQEVDPQLEFVQEIHPKPVVLLLENLDHEFEQPEVVPVPKDDRAVYPHTSVTVETSPLS